MSLIPILTKVRKRIVASTPSTPVVSGYWWNLFGEIPTANCILVFDPKNATSQSNSYINIASPGTYNLSSLGSPVPPTGTFGSGWQFTGGEGLSVGGGTGPTLKPITIICRASPISTPYNKTVIAGGSNGSLAFRVQADGGLLNIVKPGVEDIASSSSGVTLGSTSTFAITYSSAGAYVFYINGTPSGNGTNNKTFTQDMDLVGRNGYGESFNGFMKELCVYDVVLTATQITSLTTAIQAL